MYRTRNSDIGQSFKNSLSDILPNKNPESLERSKFHHSQVNKIRKLKLIIAYL